MSVTHKERIGVPPIVNISSQLRCWKTPIKQIIPITPNEIADNRLASSSIEICRGVFFSSTYTRYEILLQFPQSCEKRARRKRTSCIMEKTTPNSLCFPVPTTIPSPLPFLTKVPINAIFPLSLIGNPPTPNPA